MPADIFLKFEGPDVKGDSKDAKLKEQIECLSWSWGESVPNQGWGRVTGRVQIHEMSINKHVDKSSPHLINYCAAGQKFKKVILSQRRPTGGKEHQGPFIVFTMETAIITNYSISGAEGTADVSESITLSFAKMTYQYSVQGADGTLTAAGSATIDQEKAEAAAG